MGEHFLIEDRTSTIEILLPDAPADNNDAGLRVDFALDCLLGEEYMLARDLFLTTQEKLEQRLRSTDDRIRALTERDEELARYERSSVWNLFLWLYSLNRRLSLLRQAGFFASLVKPLQPDRRVRRNVTDYEKWRRSAGYENPNDPDA